MGHHHCTGEVERKVWRGPREGRGVEESETATGAVTIERGRELGIASGGEKGRGTEERETIGSDTTRKMGRLPHRWRSERKASEYRKISPNSR